MPVGADSIDDTDVLPAGRTRRLLGGWIPAPSTLGTFLRALRSRAVGPAGTPTLDRTGPPGRRGRPGDGPVAAAYVVVADKACDHDYLPDDFAEAGGGSGLGVGVLHGRRERLGALLRRRRVHPHDLPAVAVEVEEAA
jgi:hypothetical protein